MGTTKNTTHVETTEDADSLYAGLLMAPLIEYAHSNRGFIAALREKVNARTGKEWRRENFERWLAQDAAKRIEPKLGIGTILIEEGTALIRAWNKGR